MKDVQAYNASAQQKSSVQWWLLDHKFCEKDLRYQQWDKDHFQPARGVELDLSDSPI